jgi:DNA-binding CsgD family transcriptional regulator
MTTHRNKTRGNKTSKATRAERRSNEIKLMNDGKNQTQIAEELGISRTTFWRDLQALTVEYTKGNQESFAELRKVQVGALLDMAKEVHDGIVSPKVGTSVKGFLDSVTKLLGLNAPSLVYSKHENVSGPQLDALYLDIRQELIDLDDEAKQEALILMREFAKSRKKPVIVDAMPLQPVERSLTDGNFS